MGAVISAVWERGILLHTGRRVLPAPYRPAFLLSCCYYTAFFCGNAIGHFRVRRRIFKQIGQGSSGEKARRGPRRRAAGAIVLNSSLPSKPRRKKRECGEDGRVSGFLRGCVLLGRVTEDSSYAGCSVQRRFCQTGRGYSLCCLEERL